jgi:maleylpyruvate isomerase
VRGGEQHAPGFRAVNPAGLVPALETDDGAVLTQSLAIIEWLEEMHPAPPLLPKDATARALVRGDGPFCFGPAPTLADVCLVPQLANARRLECPLDGFPLLLRAEAACAALPAFQAAAPERQPDAG